MRRFLLPKDHRIVYARDILLFGERATPLGSKIFWRAASMLQGHVNELSYTPPEGHCLHFGVPKDPNIIYANRLEDPKPGIPIFACINKRPAANILIHAQVERSSTYTDSMLVSYADFLSTAIDIMGKFSRGPCVQRTMKTFPWSPIVGFTLTENPDGRFPDPKVMP